MNGPDFLRCAVGVDAALTLLARRAGSQPIHPTAAVQQGLDCQLCLR